MAKGSTYMRGLCIILNFLLMIFGVILLLFGIVVNSVKAAPVQDWTPQVVLLSVGFGLATFLLSVLGVYGAYREQVLPLLLYSVFMAIKFTVLMVLAIIATLAQPQMEKMIEQSFRRMTSLYNVDEVFQRELNKLQKEAQCCGLNHYTDWKNETPPSCRCSLVNSEREEKCVIATAPNFEWIRNPHSEPPSEQYYVYTKKCGPILIEYAKNGWRILLGILFTLATIEVAAVVAALLLWYKLHTRSPGTSLSEDNNSRMKYELQPEKRL
ncbi:CD63 antigen [Astyanax mexicanus]|uniref:Tetraspanin n=1 Tax=Astyanax mexicanus TaxID=7994 RepID=A0A3B1KLR5_ASTMX|nr:CD63 antigen [Astyanax mexicanus]XP_022527244.1 CD63 antigen [Astyanax mexicanus]